ncbi:MAG: hypothetical protein ABSF38_02385 [Verrucomicrobiota bacterium]
MLARISKWVVVAMLSLTLEFHWTVLQSAAWVGMMVDYSRQGSLQEAVAKTFDGKHPCPLCLLVRAGKSSERKAAAQQTVRKFDLFADCSPCFHFPPAAEPRSLSLFVLPQRFEAPAPPPPRVFPG